MNYKIAFHSDIGIVKDTNQDSCCILEAETAKGTVLLAVVCDGMGGLAKGEVASATLIQAFSKWFESELPELLQHEESMEEVKYRWGRIIREQNQSIAAYGRELHIQLGSTITAMLFFEDGSYLIGHVGDSRAYKITDSDMNMLTIDQTVVANEIRLGRLTPDQAKVDPRRNVLLQCVGASRIVEPDFYTGKAMGTECYMLCSDGFRHVISAEEIQNRFAPSKNTEEARMKTNVVQLIDLNKTRNERDNITVVLIKVE